MKPYWRKRAADQMSRDGISTAYRRGLIVKCGACQNRARYETPNGPRCFTHARAAIIRSARPSAY